MPNNSYTLNRVLFLLYFYPIAFTLRHCSFIENSPTQQQLSSVFPGREISPEQEIGDLIKKAFKKENRQSSFFKMIGDLRRCPGRIRTLTGGTRIRSATITPPGNFRVQRCKFISYPVHFCGAFLSQLTFVKQWIFIS